MKKHSMYAVKAYFSKFIKTAVVVFMLSATSEAKSQVTPAKAIISDVSGEGKAVVTYVTTGNESLFFDVKVDNAEGEKFTIVVRDDNATTLYRGSFNDKNFKKRFVIPKTDSTKITFHIRSESGVKSESFEVNTNSRIVEEVIVKKII